MGVAKVGEGERKLNQHLATTKRGSVLRLCHRRDHHGYALAVGMEGALWVTEEGKVKEGLD